MENDEARAKIADLEAQLAAALATMRRIDTERNTLRAIIEETADYLDLGDDTDRATAKMLRSALWKGGTPP